MEIDTAFLEEAENFRKRYSPCSKCKSDDVELAFSKDFGLKDPTQAGQRVVVRCRSCNTDFFNERRLLRSTAPLDFK